MPQQECVTRDRLERYVLGDLSEGDWQAIAAHVDSCPACEETVSQMDRAEDTLVRTMRGPEVRPSEPTAYRLAARRAKSLRLAPDHAMPLESSPTAQCLRDYELIEPIARGGMSTVYRAMHQRLRKQVAVKVLPDRCLANPHAVARFQREMQAVGQLRHAAIVQATDGGEEKGVHFLVMELIDGLDLSTLVKCLGPLSCPDACELTRRTALGLAHAHEQGVIHRDVKPSNVMLNSEGEVKILDLGLARIVGEQLVCDELTTVGQLMGTVDYMAPEQFESSHLADERCDVYGLGALLFKLITGHAPYSGTDPVSPLTKLRRIAGEPPPPLSTQRMDLPAELCRLVDRMLSRRPEDRPASMLEVAAALEPLCCGQRLRDLIRDGIAKHSATQRQSDLSGPEPIGLGASPTIKKPASLQEPQAATSRSGRGWKAIAGLLLLGFLVVLGIVITLQTSSGQLVIETTVPDIEVRVVRAGQIYTTLTLTQQPNTVRLGAGEYEVQIVGPADGLLVENQRFTLTRGQTIVARIAHTPTVAAAAATPPTITKTDALPKTQLPEPRYDGKTTAEWIAILFEDRSPDRVIAAFDALQKLGLDQNLRDDAIRAIFHAARFHEKPPLRTSTGARTATSPPPRSVWFTAVQSLRTFDDSAVVAHARALLDDPAYRPKYFVFYVLKTNALPYRSLLSGPLQKQLRQFSEQGPVEERQESMNALALLLGKEDPRFMEICRAWISKGDDFGRLNAARWLVAAKQSSPEVVNVLLPMLTSAAPDIQAEIAIVLGDMGNAAKLAVPDLIAVVEVANQPRANSTDDQLDVSARRAIEALGRIGDPSAAPVLIREWRRRVAFKEEASTGINLELQRREMFDGTALIKSIQALTGLVHNRSSSEEYWTKDGVSLSQACNRFLTAESGMEATVTRQKCTQQIEQILLVSTESEVEESVVHAINITASNNLKAIPLAELLELLRPKLPQKSEYRTLLKALVELQQRNRTPNQTVLIKSYILAETQKFLSKRAADSPEAREQIFDALAEAIESSRGLELVVLVDTLVALGIPDIDRSNRIVNALEAALRNGNPEITWKKEAVERGIKHLRGEAADRKPST